jgi:transporter family-2 protein
MQPSSFLLFALVTLFAGASVTIQQVLNANLRTELGSPWWAAAVSYLVGLAATASIALLARGPGFAASFARTSPSLSWTGGLFGATFITIAILMVPRLGAATTLALMVLGQMAASVLLDHYGVLGLAQHPLSLLRLAGVACIILGVVLVRV